MKEILLKYLTGSASEAERAKARKWINECVENRRHFEELNKYYQLTKLVQVPTGFNTTEGWERVRSGYYKQRLMLEMEDGKINRRRIIQWVSVASVAAVFIAFMLGAYISKQRGSIISQNLYNEIVVPMGSKTQLTLPDGTKVWLNAGSRFKYPAGLFAGKREVYLEGEAFFDVTSDKRRIFIVQTGDINVKVYGTQFNIKSYPDENQIQTTLVKGSVAIEPVREKGRNKIVYLQPNQTATYYRSSMKLDTQSSLPSQAESKVRLAEKIEVVPKADLLPIISWKDNKWVISGAKLGDLAVELERRYNVVISFESENLKSYKFSGTLTNETFEQVLRIMQLSAPLLYTIEGNRVIFREDTLYKKKYDKMINNIH